MRVMQAIAGGAGRTFASPLLLVLLWLVNVVIAVPATVVVGSTLHESFGDRLVADRMRQGFDTAWYGEFRARASGAAETFSPSVTGPGTVFDQLEAWWSGGLFTEYPGIVALGIVYALVWAFLTGGVLSHVGRSFGRFDAVAFGAAGGRCFRRFVGLAIVSGALYALVFLLGRRLYRLLEDTTIDLTSEEDVLARVVLAAALVVVLLHLVRMVFDYAKIAAALDPERGVVRSLASAIGTVVRHPLRALSVYVAFGVAGLLLMTGYAWIAPGAGQSTARAVALAFAVSQLYLFLRIAVRVVLLASEVRVYRDANPVPRGDF